MPRQSQSQCKDGSAAWLLVVNSCPCLMVPVYNNQGEWEKSNNREKNRTAVEMEGWTGRVGRADKQKKKVPSVSISVTFGGPASALLHTKQSWRRAVKKKKKALTARASDRALRPMSLFTDTLDRREWEQGCGPCGTDGEMKQPRLV